MVVVLLAVGVPAVAAAACEAVSPPVPAASPAPGLPGSATPAVPVVEVAPEGEGGAVTEVLQGGGGAPASGPGFIRCGGQACQAGEQVCCGRACKARGEGPLFVPSDMVPGAVEPRVCRDVVECDDSGDCAPGDVCCWTAIHAALCQPAPAICETQELCGGSGSCRTPGAECIDGRCLATDASIPCGHAKCEGDSPVCCLHDSEPRCVGRDAPCPYKTNTVRLVCRNSGDCLRGQRCCHAGGATYCAGRCPDEDPPVCTSSAECRDVWATMTHGEAVRANVCAKLARFDLRICVPPDRAKALP